jgi:hypothetical protein
LRVICHGIRVWHMTPVRGETYNLSVAGIGVSYIVSEVLLVVSAPLAGTFAQRTRSATPSVPVSRYFTP